MAQQAALVAARAEEERTAKAARFGGGGDKDGWGAWGAGGGGDWGAGKKLCHGHFLNGGYNTDGACALAHSVAE